MTLETDCNECGDPISGGEKIFCEDCWEEFKNKIENLEYDVKILMKERDELQADIDKMEE